MAEQEHGIGKAQLEDVSVYQGNRFEAQISETADTFTAQVTDGKSTVVFHYSPPDRISFEIVSFVSPGSPAPESAADDRPHVTAQSQEAEQAVPPEKEQAVKLYGRSATEPYKAKAPSGEPMVIVSFAEHPSWHQESFGNMQPGKIKDDTRYWQAAAFGSYAEELAGLPKGKASILIGYPKQYTKVGKGGKEETVSNGFQVVDRKPYVGTPKPRHS